MSLFGNIGTTISGVAKTATGDVANFRSVLNLNPSLIPFSYPPQVQAGITVLNTLGVKIPTADQIKADVLAPVNKALSGITRDLDKANSVLSTVSGKVSSITSVLQTIDWLL